jgi:hypothetical protein
MAQRLHRIRDMMQTKIANLTAIGLAIVAIQSSDARAASCTADQCLTNSALRCPTQSR